MSEWLFFSAKVAYFHQYHDQNKLRPFGFIAPKSLNFLAFQSFYFERTDEGYSRNVSCALNLIYTFLLHSIRWDGIDVRFVLYQHAYSDLHSASSLKQQSASEYMAPLRHIILIPCQPVFALLNAACLAEEQQIPLLYSLVWPGRDSNPLEVSTLTNTPNRFKLLSNRNS